MKRFLLIALVAALADAQAPAGPPGANIREIFSSCQKEFKISDQDIQKFVQNPWDPANASNAVKCHLKCAVEKLNLFKDNQPIEAVVTDLFSKLPGQKMKVEEIKQTVASCKSEKGTDDCDTVYKVLACIGKKGLTLN